MKAERSSIFHFIPSEQIVIIKGEKPRQSARVGQSWQPEVAQFLLDMFPSALEMGMNLSQLYQIALFSRPDGVSQPQKISSGNGSADNDNFEDGEDL